MWKTTAQTCKAAKQNAAVGVSHSAMPVNFGANRPIAPRISSVPIVHSRFRGSLPSVLASIDPPAIRCIAATRPATIHVAMSIDLLDLCLVLRRRSSDDDLLLVRCGPVPREVGKVRGVR